MSFFFTTFAPAKVFKTTMKKDYQSNSLLISNFSLKLAA